MMYLYVTCALLKHQLCDLSRCNGGIRPLNPAPFVRKHRLPNFEHRSKEQSSVISKKGNDMEEKYRVQQCQRRNQNENRHRRSARSLSPQRNSSHLEGKEQRKSGLIDDSAEEQGVEGIKIVDDASPSTLPKARGSRRTWSFREIFLPRRASEGRELGRHEMELSFSSYVQFPSSDKKKKSSSAQGKPAQKKKTANTTSNRTAYISSPNKREVPASAQELQYIPGPNRRGVPVSAHELHYTANRAQAEELRRKTFLPYRQSVLGCLVFPSTPALPQDRVSQPLY